MFVCDMEDVVNDANTKKRCLCCLEEKYVEDKGRGMFVAMSGNHTTLRPEAVMIEKT